MKQHRTGWRWLLFLAAIEAGAALVALAFIPRETAAYSLARSLLLGVLACLCALWTYLALRLPSFLQTFERPRAILASAAIALGLAVSLFLLRYLDPEVLAPYYRRLAPIAWYLLVLCVEAAIFLMSVVFGFHNAPLDRLRSIRRPAGWSLLVLLLVLVFVSTTRVGLTPDSAYWGEPGVPVMGWQLALAILAGLVILLVGLRVRRTLGLDAWLGAGLWLLAVVIWLSVPLSVMQNSFYAPMGPPTGEAFPNSDAGYYDSMAQSLLIGYPYQNQIPTRPLYIVALTALHLVAGERYGAIVAGQTLILALIPVLLYLLGTRVHSRAAGISIALLAIFRELNTLLVSSQTRVSDTKTLLVDLPTLLLLSAACLMVMRWLERRNAASGLAAGGMFGALLLLRTQAAMILPPLVLLVVLAYGLRNRSWIVALASFVLAAGLTVTPWLVRNYFVSGQLALDAPFQYQIIASQYRYTGNLDLGSVDLQGKSLAGMLLQFALHDPKFVLGFVSSHFMATQIGGLLALPLIEPYNGLLAPLNLYWLSWNGSLSWWNLCLVLCYLTLIAIGLGAAWNRVRWAGLAPLAFSLGYSLANGVGRFSGWRYDLPADWIWYFYLCIGVAEIGGLLALLFGARAQSASGSGSVSPIAPTQSARTRIPLLGFILIGALPWLAQGIAGPRYADESASGLVSTLASAPSVKALVPDGTQIESFAAMRGATVQIGRVLYPRFFSRQMGLASTHPWPAYAPRDFPRLGFLLLNETRHDVIFPTRQAPASVPHAADAIVLGCQGPEYIEARLILLVDSGSAYQSGPLDKACP